jgi:hypothetical protein
MLLLDLGLGRGLRLLVQALASLAGELLGAAHTAVVIERMETAGRCRSRALVYSHARGRAPRRRPRALWSISARESAVLMLLRLEKKCHDGPRGSLAPSYNVRGTCWESAVAMSDRFARGAESREDARFSIDQTSVGAGRDRAAPSNAVRGPVQRQFRNGRRRDDNDGVDTLEGGDN